MDHRAGKKPTPEDSDAYELLTDRIDFQVESVIPRGAAAELVPPLGRLEMPRDSSVTNRWMWIAIIFFGVVVIVVLALIWIPAETGSAAYGL